MSFGNPSNFNYAPRHWHGRRGHQSGQFRQEMEGGWPGYGNYEYEEEGRDGVTCDDKDFPQTKVNPPKAVSRSKVTCTTNAQFNIIAAAVKSAIGMLDNTIKELTEARKAACAGKKLTERNLQPITVCWLKYHLGVCVDEPWVWTKGTFENKTVAEVIRRLIRPRDLLANNELTFLCDSCNPADPTRFCNPANACTHARDQTTGLCITGAPPRIVGLCPPFFTAAFAPFREETLMHETAHITHCDAGPGSPDSGVGVSIGFATCLAEFVAATNGRELNPGHRPHAGPVGPLEQICGYTNTCGPIPKEVLRGNCPR